MTLRLLLHVALLGLGTTPPLVQGRSFCAPAVAWPFFFDLDLPLEVQETIQIPSNGSGPLLADVQVLVIKTSCDFELLRFPRDHSDRTLSFYALSDPWLSLPWHTPLPSCLLPLSYREAIAPNSQGPTAGARPPLEKTWGGEFRSGKPSWGGQSHLHLCSQQPSGVGTVRGHQLVPALLPRGLGAGQLLARRSLSASHSDGAAFQAHGVHATVSVQRECVVQDLETQVLPRQPVPCFQVTVSRETRLKAITSLLVPREALLLADVLCGGPLLPLEATERTADKVPLLPGYLVFHSSQVQALPSSSSCNPLLSEPCALAWPCLLLLSGQHWDRCPPSPVYDVTILLLLLFLGTTEMVRLAGRLARDHLRAEKSPSPRTRQWGVRLRTKARCRPATPSGCPAAHAPPPMGLS
ncbi:LOW QUALITY PROTEIN: ligand-gated cation channel ZACN [Glossophaga mutica]